MLLALVLPAAGDVRSLAAAAPMQDDGQTALVAVLLDEPARISQAQAAGLVLYRQFASNHGDYLLVGAPLDQDDRLRPLPFPATLLDGHSRGASYYMAYPLRGQEHFGPISWSNYGQVVLDLGDQVLLRTSPQQAEQLPDLGVEIVHIDLEPQVWPSAASAPDAGPDALTPDPAVQAMLNQVSVDSLSHYLSQLSGLEPVTVEGSTYTITTRNTNSGTPIQKASHFIGEHLQGLGLNLEYHIWGSSGTPSTYPNVIGQRTGSTNPNDIYIIGAHLDDLPSTGNAPGADDNGSGSVATLLAADILSQYQWSCTLRFAFWTGEEQGILGSAAYATRAKNNNENIKGYLNMDMLGYNASAPNEINLFARSSVPGSVDMMNLYADAISAYGLNLVPIKYTNDSLGDRSDNGSFWNKGYASMLAIEDYYGDFTPYYHTSNDKLSTINMTYYTDFVKASLATFVHLTGCLVTGPTPTPTNTPVPPTATNTPTNTPVPPTATNTPTNTPVPPTATSTPTNTPVPPTATNTPTNTPVPPTATNTPTNTPVPPTATNTPTNTPVPPTATNTPTNTPVPPTATNTPTNTPCPARNSTWDRDLRARPGERPLQTRTC